MNWDLQSAVYLASSSALQMAEMTADLKAIETVDSRALSMAVQTDERSVANSALLKAGCLAP